MIGREAPGNPDYMIHASDHDDAPGFMRRAYDTAVRTNTDLNRLAAIPANSIGVVCRKSQALAITRLVIDR